MTQPMKAGLYARLSREDGDGLESDSITNQLSLLQSYVDERPALAVYDTYIDDGFTGTNFARPAFQRMLGDIEDGNIQCVIVKDLSRFGRDYIEAGRYLERWFPAHDVRFIAVTDGIDSGKGPIDMLVAFKNIFNAQYAKDISVKVQSAIRTKQKKGEFIGSFACYGYQKDPINRNHLVIDPPAAQVVQRIFSAFEGGMGKVGIARMLNEEKVPCPSEYKKMLGQKYHNSHRLTSTTYWTYATIHRILQSEMYIGNMEQSRDLRSQMHGKAKRKDRSDWIIVNDTHEPIISRDQWDRVQKLLRSGARELDFESNVSPFAGVLVCGDCGRAMAKTRWGDKIYYTCGSYKRYGASTCSSHYILHADLEQIVLDDLNHIIAQIRDWKALAESCRKTASRPHSLQKECQRLQSSLDRVQRLKKESYEDYKDGLLSKADFLRYQKDYEEQEQMLSEQLRRMEEAEKKTDPLDEPWVKSLLSKGKLTELDRATITETIDKIRIFENHRIEIDYRFSAEYAALFPDPGELPKPEDT